MFCCLGMSARSLWIKGNMLQNHCDLQYFVARGCLSEIIGPKQKHCETIVIYSIMLPRGSVRSLWIKANLLQNHCVLQYYAATVAAASLFRIQETIILTARDSLTGHRRGPSTVRRETKKTCNPIGGAEGPRG